MDLDLEIDDNRCGPNNPPPPPVTSAALGRQPLGEVEDYITSCPIAPGPEGDQDGVEDDEGHTARETVARCRGKEGQGSPHHLALNDPTGQRVLQIVTLLRNLSFERENAEFIADSDVGFRLGFRGFTL